MVAGLSSHFRSTITSSMEFSEPGNWKIRSSVLHSLTIRNIEKLPSISMSFTTYSRWSRWRVLVPTLQRVYLSQPQQSKFLPFWLLCPTRSVFKRLTRIFGSSKIRSSKNKGVSSYACSSDRQFLRRSLACPPSGSRQGYPPKKYSQPGSSKIRSSVLHSLKIMSIENLPFISVSLK